MWPLLLLATLPAFAQELDLSSIRALEERLPDYNQMGRRQDEFKGRPREENQYRPPKTVTKWESIQNSEVSLGSARAGVRIVRIEDNQVFKLSRHLYVRHYQLPDENGFIYLINQDGSTTFRIDNNYLEPIKQELALYEPPLKYTPAPLNKVRREFDKELPLLPEASIYGGYVMGEFMKDLFNDPEARSGYSNQFALNVLANWKLPIKAGATLHFEKTNYDLSRGGNINYSSVSFGPLLRTRDFEYNDALFRFKLQVRVSPFSRATAEIPDVGSVTFKFNSTDLMGSLEHALKNPLGEFVIGAFMQAQWLNFRDQPEIVSVRASNKANTSIGFYLAQVFH